jgi:hypothetical protein
MAAAGKHFGDDALAADLERHSPIDTGVGFLRHNLSGKALSVVH